MRRLNVKFLVCLIIPMLLIAGGVHLLWAINVNRSSQLFLDQAASSLKEANHRAALNYYNQYLARNSDDKDKLCEAALVAAKLVDGAEDSPSPSDARTAYEFMSRALRKVPERSDIRYRLVDLLVKVGHFDEARRHIEQLEAAGKLDVKMQFNYAIALARIDKVDQAIERLYEIVGYDSSKQVFDEEEADDAYMLDAYALLAELLETKKENLQLANRVMDQLVTANPELAEAHMMLGRYLRRTNTRGDEAQRTARLERAHKHLRTSYQLAPKDLDVLLENAVLALGTDDVQEAGKFLEVAKAEHPQDAKVYLLSGRVAVLQEDIEGAIREYKAGIEQIPDNLDLVWYLFESQLQTNDLKGAQATVARMKQLDFPRVRIELAEAQLPLLEERWLEASQKLEEVRPSLANDPNLAVNVNLLLARCFANLKQLDQERQSYERALQISEDSLPAARGMASALMRLHNYAEAYKLLVRIREKIGKEEFAKDRALARSLYQVALILQQQGTNNTAIARDLESARQSITQATGGVAAPEAILAADRLLKHENINRAAMLLREALRETPDDVRLQNAFLRVFIKQRGPAAGLKFLDTALSRGWQDSADFRIIRSQLYVKLNPPELKARLADLEIDADQFNESDQFRLWQALGSAYYSRKPRDLDSARRCWENAVKVRPTELELVHVLFEVNRERGDALGEAAVIDLMQKTFGEESGEAQYFRALQALGNYRRDPSDREELDKVASMAVALAKSRPDWSWAALLNAQIEDLQGRREQAITSYQEALVLGPARPKAVSRLVELLISESRYREAQLALDQLNPIPKEMLRYKVLLEAMQGDQQKALDVLSDAVDDDSEKPQDFLWKGRVLSHLQQPDNATKAYVRALQLAPALPQAWLTLVEHLVRNDQSQNAEQFTRQAENNLSTDQAPLVLAQCYALMGNHALAEQYYQLALDAAPEDLGLLRTVAAYYLGVNQPSKSERYLRGILRLTDSSHPSRSIHAVWARRMLAQVLARDGSYLRFRTALALLAANWIDGQPDDTDKAIEAELLGARVEPQFRREGLRMLQKLQDEGKPLTLSQRIRLAKLHEQSNWWEKARNLMVDVVRDHPQSADALAQLNEMLLDHKDIAVASNWINELEKIEPKSYRTLRLRARELVQLDAKQEALQRIDSWVPEPPQPSDAGRLLQAARLLEELKFFPAAEEKFTAFDKLTSGKTLVLAGFQARQGRINEAFQLVADRATNDNVKSISGAAMFVMSQLPAKVTDVQFQQAENWVQLAMAQDPADLSLTLNWSSTLELLGKTQLAEKILSDALNANLTRQQRGAVLNNLAYLRAVHGATDIDTQRLVDEAEKLVGPHPMIMDSRAMIHLAQSQCSLAVDQLKEALSFGDESGIYHFHLALAYQCTSDRSAVFQALEDAERMEFSVPKLSVYEQQRYRELQSWLTR